MSPKDAILGSKKLREMVENSVKQHIKDHPDATREEQDDFDCLNWISLLSTAGQVKVFLVFCVFFIFITVLLLLLLLFFVGSVFLYTFLESINGK